MNYVIHTILNASNYHFSFLSLCHLSTCVLILILTILILVRENFSQASYLFSFISFCFIVWIGSNIPMIASTSPAVAKWWTTPLTIGVVFISPSAYIFVLSITNKLKYYKHQIFYCLGISFFFALTVLGTDQFITGLHHYSWGYYPQYGSFLSLLFLIVFAFILGNISIIFWKEYKTSAALKQKNRFKNFQITYIIATTAALDFLPAYGINIIPLGFIPVSIFIISLFSLIRKYDLMDFSPEIATEQIIETMNDVLLLINKEGIIQFINSAAENFFEKNKNEIIGKHAVQLIQNPKFSQDFNKMLKLGTTKEYEVSFLKKNSEKRFLQLFLLPIRNPLRQVLAVVCIGQDKTDFKKAEMDLNKAFKIPKTIIEGIHVGVVVSDQNNKINYINQTAMHLLGFSGGKDSLLKSPKIHIHNDWNETADKSEKSSFEETITNSSGESLTVLKTSLPLDVENEKLRLDVFVNISNRKELEKQLEDYKSYLEKLVRERTLELETANASLFEEVNGRKKADAELRLYLEDLEKFQKITSDRMTKMEELKLQANQLAHKLGRPDIYS